MESIHDFSAPAKRLEGKVALITGAASGIGESTARLFSLHGAKVVIADIQDDKGISVCKDLGGPASAIYVHCDVTSEDDVRNAVNTAVDTYGKLDVMYNNAGIIDTLKPMVDNEKTDFERVIAVNLTGMFIGTKHAARVMIPARSGSIISIASVASVIGGVGTYGYTCSKHAVVGMTKNAAVELGQYGIRVNCVSPYAAATPLSTGFASNAGFGDFEDAMSKCAVLKGPILKVEDVAFAVLYLASDDAKYVSGHNLVVDGGYSIVNPSLSANRGKSPQA